MMKNMKKLFCFALAVVMLLSVMAGCAAKTEQGSSTTQASESTASTEIASNESADASDAAANHLRPRAASEPQWRPHRQ